MLALTRNKLDAVQLKSRLFRGFSDPSRLSILETLKEGSCSVSELVRRTGLSQSNVSNHLACLRDCGLVTTRAQGKSVIYSLSDERVGLLLSMASELLQEVARGVYSCVQVAPGQEDG